LLVEAAVVDVCIAIEFQNDRVLSRECSRILGDLLTGDQV
jgi:hypothetical protein